MTSTDPLTNLFQKGALRTDPAGATCYQNGTCLYNIDGNVVKGGQMIGGVGGYRQGSLNYLSSDGGCGAQCVSAQLFCSFNNPYGADSQGSACATDARVLKVNRWGL